MTRKIRFTEGVININGVGFNTNSLNTSVNGKISKFNFNDYDYNNISLNGNLKHPVFDGNITSKDENLDFEFNGLVDVSKSLNQYKFKTSVDYADLHSIKVG